MKNTVRLLSLLVPLVAFTACGPKKQAAAPPPADVDVVTVQSADVPLYTEWIGTLDGYVNAQIRAQVTGYLMAQDYREGGQVKKGDLLFHIDPRPFQAALDQAKGQLAQAAAQFDKTELDVERYTPLAKEKAISQEELVDAEHASLVVYLFLQGWRATLIPMLAVPVALIGTFAVFPLLGFSINTLSLFGLVLAVGLVVDDAIVVVEAVEHHTEEGMTPKEASFKAMEEVSGPVIGIARILTAVFVPTVFIPGITGRLYQQFAVTIAISVLISAFNALTLSPALSALLLRPRKKTRGPLGRFFEGFNRVYGRATNGYVGMCSALIRKATISMVFLGLVAVAVGWFGKAALGLSARRIRGTYSLECSFPLLPPRNAPTQSAGRSRKFLGRLRASNITLPWSDTAS